MPGTSQIKSLLRSDTLRLLLCLADSVAAVRLLMGNIIQVIAVLDASQVHREIRWRVGSRNKADARTSLHETIASGALLAFAPPFLEAEIEKYIPQIAEGEGVSVDRVTEEWHLLKPLIRFYEPVTGEHPAAC